MTRLFIILLLFVSTFAFSQITTICAIQGDGAASPLDGLTVNTTGTVTAVFNQTNQLNGFFMQDHNCQTGATNSGGIFVYDPGGTAVSVGDSITLTADVSEFFGLTEISNVSGLTVLSSGHSFSPIQIVLPFITDEELEGLEGMVVSFPQQLVATDHFNWARYGEVIFSANTRLEQPSNLVDPNDADPAGTTGTGNSNVANLLSLQMDNDRNRILVDDASSVQYSGSPPFLDGQGTFRAGSSVSGLQGVLSYSFGNYRLYPTSVSSVSSTTRPLPPFEGTTDLQVVSFNVLNYWTTIGGWGAQSAAEFNRQRTKLAFAMQEMDADIYGLMELENNNATAYEDLLEALNDEVGDGTYLALDAKDPGIYPTKSVIFYKPASVTPVGPLRSLNDPIFERPTLSQIFETNDGGQFNYVLNHLRFKGCDGATGLDLDQGDGQACFNETRRQQALAVLNFIDTIRTSTGIEQILIGGDFNAYSQEDPVDIIEGAGYHRLLPLDAYTFSFFGQWGALDHAFASIEMMSAVSGAAIWHVNADEPRGLGWEDVSSALYQPNPYRSSDHDPVCVTIETGLLSTAVEDIDEGLAFNVFPNPYVDKISFEYELPVNGHILLELFDALGKPAGVVIDQFETAGQHAIIYDCDVATGQFLLYKMTVTSNDGTIKSTSGKLIKADRR